MSFRNRRVTWTIKVKNAKIIVFYCATIAYHVGLNALLVAARNYDQRLRKKDIYSGRSLRLSSRDLPLMLQLFSLVAAILQSLGSIYCHFLSISQCSVIVIRPFLCISFIIVYSTFWPIFSTSAFVIVLNFKFCELASLSSHINIQMDQKMGAFQASMLEAFNNLREDFQKSLQKPREMDQTSSSSATKTNAPSKDLESMEVEYGPDLPPRLDSYSSRLEDDLGQLRSSAEDPSQVASTKPKQAAHSSRHHVVDPSSASDLYLDYSINPQLAPSRPKKHSDKSKHKSRSRFLTPSSEEDQSPEHRHRSPKPSRKSYSNQDHPQHDPDPPYYREVALSDIPSQYAEEVDTFRRILKLPDPRESLPRSSTAVMGLDDEKGRQELRPRGPSSMLPLNSVIKDAFEKFDQDCQAANLPEGKYIKPPPSTAKWYMVGQPCYEDKIQELNTDFAKICISPKPSGAPMGKVPMPILKELEHQARQNISTLNFTTTFAKTSSSCNVTLEKCQHSLKATFKKVKSQIRKGADPEKAAKRGYEEACEYLDLWNKAILIQHRALTCLSKSLAHILQRELYSMGNTGLLR